MRIKIVLFTLSILLIGCVPSPATPSEVTLTPATIAPDVEIETEESERQPIIVEYNLGETTITQSMFSPGDRFYDMPVRLNGIITMPAGNAGPYPVVLILHGNHPGCPIPDGDEVDRWPCDPEQERRNYPGFTYLMKNLAEQGYVALSINVNAEYTFGFGEPVHLERLGQLVDLHLAALASANAGGENGFGIPLEGQADMSRMVFIGHSQGAESAFHLIQQKGLDSADTIVNVGYGPVYGLVMIASAANWAGAEGARIPLAMITPSCDMDVFNQDGLLYYEITRMELENPSWVTSVWFERANHNHFNETLSDERMTRMGRPDCEPLLEQEIQKSFLSDFTLAFLASIFSQDNTAFENLGMDIQAVVPDKIFGLEARVAILSPSDHRLLLLLPASEAELETNLAGGSVIAENVTTFYCEEGYYTPFVKPGSEPCKRVNLVIPGNPAMVVVSWEQPDGELRFMLPEENNLSEFTALSLRAAVDPLSPLNVPGETQALTIRLVDQQGNSAEVSTRENEPALWFPEGHPEDDDVFEGGLFTGRVPLTTIRVPLSEFSGINLGEIREIVLAFNQKETGSLFMADIELVW